MWGSYDTLNYSIEGAQHSYMPDMDHRFWSACIEEVHIIIELKRRSTASAQLSAYAH